MKGEPRRQREGSLVERTWRNCQRRREVGSWKGKWNLGRSFGCFFLLCFVLFFDIMFNDSLVVIDIFVLQDGRGFTRWERK